jgi:hypothetical protein
MNTVVALLDRPNKRSLGVVPVLLNASGRLVTSGLASGSVGRKTTVRDDVLDHLVRTGEALRVEPVTAPIGVTDYVALWVGDEFQDSLLATGLRLPPMPVEGQSAEDGTFYLGTATEMYVYLERWVDYVYAALVTLPTSAEKRIFAGLMRWTLPKHVKTLAASWEANDYKVDYLRKQHRLLGERVSLEDFKARLEGARISSQRFLQDKRVVVFTGKSGSRRQFVAQAFTESFRKHKKNVAFVTYKTPVSHITHSQDKFQLMRDGQAIVDRAPLYLALAPFSTTPIGQDDTVVLDSVLHPQILEAIEWLGPRQLTVVKVSADEALLGERIQQEDHIDPRAVLAHPTNTFVDAVATKARFFVNTGGDYSPQVEHLVRDVLQRERAAPA